MKFLIVIYTFLIALPCYAGDYKDFVWGMSVKDAKNIIDHNKYKYKNIDKSTVRPWVDKDNRSHLTIVKHTNVLGMEFTMKLHFFSDSLTYIELDRSYVLFSGNSNQEGEFEKIQEGLIKKYGKETNGFWDSENTVIEFNKKSRSPITGRFNYRSNAWTYIRYYSKQNFYKLEEHNKLLETKALAEKKRQEKKKERQIENDL